MAAAVLRRILFVLGGPGSGKGTCCEALVARYPRQVVHLSAGALLRESLAAEPTGLVANYLAAGHIVPSHITLGLLRRHLQPPSSSSSSPSSSPLTAATAAVVLIDGFPRNQENHQAFMREMGGDAAGALLIDVSPEVCRQRLLARRRDDDHADSIRARLQVFQSDTQPILAAFAQRDALLVVPGEAAPATVAATAAQLLIQRGFLTPEHRSPS
jgi:UMP-CMP kinase